MASLHASVPSPAPPPPFNLLAHNTLDKSIFNANPAVSHSQLFLRSDQYLYCIGR